MKKSLSIKVEGRVQGVAFRYYTSKKASQLGLSGWVKNLSDGRTVEIFAEGEEGKLEKLLDWARQGPSSANVLDYSYDFGEFTGNTNGFHVRY